MKKVFFITGTDTGVGKTLVASALLEAANRRGLKTAAIKPVAAGCEQTAEGLRNEDALMLQQAASLTLAYEQINPIALEPAIAPHIASEREDISLEVSDLISRCQPVLSMSADLTVVEGAGGWRVPLNPEQTLADFAVSLRQPVILVVGMRLGCINHALLTAEAIVADGLPLAGWVANRIAPAMSHYPDNLATLKERLPCPLLGEIPYLPGPNYRQAPEHLKEAIILL